MKTLLLVVVAALFFSGTFVNGKIGIRRLRNYQPCDTPGYFGDAEDCMKFYRCAEHETGEEGKPLLAKFTFQCPVGTAFDEELSTCNFPHSLMNVPPNCPTEIPTEPSSPPGQEGESSDNNSSTPPPASSDVHEIPSATGAIGGTNKVITLTSITNRIHPFFIPQIPMYTPYYYSNALYLKK